MALSSPLHVLNALDRREFLKAAVIGSALAFAGVPDTALGSERPISQPKRKPNIICILADDLGYGDVSCLNPRCGRIHTPNIDRLASQGMLFTDAHAGTSVCSPSRYALLAGRYSWRRLTAGIVNPYGQPGPLIADDRLTIAGLLKGQGYSTAAFGKWHLGWNWPKKGKDFCFDQRLPGGPVDHGFDHYFGTDVPNWPPYCWIENDRTVGIPSDPLPIQAEWTRTIALGGPAVPGWNLEAILPTLTDKVCDYIEGRAEDKKPFFVYFALTSPHTPIVPTPEWKGKSGISDYADYVMETDAMIGRVTDTLKAQDLEDDTLVVLTSDNGCAHYIGVPQMEAKGHYPSAWFRGYKSDIWDGGHRMPFIARWPNVIQPKTRCDKIICLTDLMATAADITGVKLPDNAGEDSVSTLSLLKGSSKAVREEVIHYSNNGRFAVRDERWKLELCSGSGGCYAGPTDADADKQGLPPVQLYDMQSDPGELDNVYKDHPDVVKRLTSHLQECVARGRSTPGAPQSNDVVVDIYKSPAVEHSLSLLTG